LRWRSIRATDRAANPDRPRLFIYACASSRHWTALRNTRTFQCAARRAEEARSRRTLQIATLRTASSVDLRVFSPLISPDWRMALLGADDALRERSRHERVEIAV